MFNVFCGGESIHVDFFGGEGIAEGGLVCSCSEVEGCGIELQERMLDAFKVKDGQSQGYVGANPMPEQGSERVEVWL